MIKVKIINIFVALFIFITIFTTPVSSTGFLVGDIDTLNKDKKDIQQEVESHLIEIEETSNISKEVQEEIKILDKQVAETYDELEEVEVDLANLEKDIDDNLTQLNKSEDILEEKQEKFNARMRVMYMNGSVGYLELLLTSKDINDFFSRREMIKAIAKEDKELIETVTTQKNIIEEKNSELMAQKESLSELKSSVRLKGDELEKAISAKHDLVQELELDAEQLDEEYNVLNGLLDEVDSEIIEYEENIEYEEKEQQKEEQEVTTTSNPKEGMSKPISNQSDILNKLNSLRDGYNSIGIDFTIPYVYGGNSSSGMDCSAFTKDVYRQLGVNLPRTSRAQAKVGKRVSRVNLKPGDLVIFSGTYRGGPSHTGVYLGAGEFIHQSSSGNGATVSKLTGYYGRHFSYGRRLF